MYVRFIDDAPEILTLQLVVIGCLYKNAVEGIAGAKTHFHGVAVVVVFMEKNINLLYCPNDGLKMLVNSKRPFASAPGFWIDSSITDFFLISLIIDVYG